MLARLLATCAALLVLAAPAGATITTPETIDLDAFANGIHDRLDGHVVGFAFAIARNGAVVRSGAGGYRRVAQGAASGFASAPDPFTPDTMAQAASASKTITAAALLKALDEQGISPDAKIGPYLPHCWKQGPGIADLTFRDVLGHHTLLPKGSGCSDHPLLCLLEAIKAGRGPAQADNYEYSNTAYGLVRVLLPFVRARNAMQLRFGFNPARCEARVDRLNKVVSDRFRAYVFDHVLGPVGVKASFYPQGDGIADFALNYNRDDLTQPAGVPRADFHLHAGAGYLAIGARDYARFLSALRAGLILPMSLAGEMTGVPGNRMGFDTDWEGRLGAYTWKNGGCPSHGGTKPGCSTLAMVYPSGVQAYVAINSSNNDYAGGLDDILGQAFDDALL